MAITEVGDKIKIGSRSGSEEVQEFEFTKFVLESNEDVRELLDSDKYNGQLAGEDIFKLVNYAHDLKARAEIRNAKTPKSASKKYIIEITSRFLATTNTTKLIEIMSGGDQDNVFAAYYDEHREAVDKWIRETLGEGHVPVLKANAAGQSQALATPEEL